MPIKYPIVVYHVAGMGDWKFVAEEQIKMLVEVGLTKGIRVTYLGRELDYLKSLFDHYKIGYTIVRNDPNTDHCETFAMIEIDRLAKKEQVQVPILYFHTKGVSAPGNRSKRAWRYLMEAWVVRRWQANVLHLDTYDAVGVNFIEGGPQHFSGTFWMANPNWIRRLPDFEEYHVRHGLHRYTCELWIGAAEWCKYLSLGCKNEPFWAFNYDYQRWMPPMEAAIPSNIEKPLFTANFADIFNYYNSDKTTDHTYGPVYDRLFPPKTRESVSKVLEIGAHTAASLHSWELAFPNASVYGLESSFSIATVGDRTDLITCNPVKPRDVYEALKAKGIDPGDLDLIVDDGNHAFKDQLAKAAILKSYLSHGGIYIVEDVYPHVGADVIAKTLGGFVLDRRGVKKRFDDTLVILGGDARDVYDLQNVPDQDIPSIFGEE